MEISINNIKDLSNDNSQNEIKKKKIRNKHKLYPNERKELLLKLFSLLNVSKTKNIFYSHEVESEETRQKILDMSSDIVKYFNVSTWSCFKNNVNVEKQALSLMRHLFREMHVEYLSGGTKKKINEHVINTTFYTITNISHFFD